MINLGNSFTGLESKAETFHAAQTRQAEMQTRLHDQMQIEMQTTRGLLDEVTFSATTLKATVDSTAFIIGKLASLNSFTRWIPALGLGIWILFALHLVSPKYAGYTGAAIGKLPPKSSISPADWILQHFRFACTFLACWTFSARSLPASLPSIPLWNAKLTPLPRMKGLRPHSYSCHYSLR